LNYCEILGRNREVKRLIDESEKTGREVGALICRVDDRLELGAKCTGTECGILLEDCKEGEMVGGFHTHPRIVSKMDIAKYPSPSDIETAILQERKFSCIGYREDGKDKVVCFCPPEDRRKAELLINAFKEVEREVKEYNKRKSEYDKKLAEYKCLYEMYEEMYEELVKEADEIEKRAVSTMEKALTEYADCYCRGDVVG